MFSRTSVVEISYIISCDHISSNTDCFILKLLFIQNQTSYLNIICDQNAFRYDKNLIQIQNQKS